MGYKNTSEDSLKKLQKSIFSNLKKKALALEEGSKELKSYQNAQHRYSKREFEISDLEELIYSINKSQIVYLGDFHSFDQSSKNMERLLIELSKNKNQKLALGVEFVFQEHQNSIDFYLKGFISELEFLEEVDYCESWRFPWQHYRPFFQMARKFNFDVLALNSRGTLKERDLNASKKIVDYIHHNPTNKFLVLFGELHIIPNKLPQLVQRQMNNLHHTIIHQNLDTIYWKVRETDVEPLDTVVAFSKNEFCLLSSPPWIKYESMIYWYENLCDDPDFDLHERILELRPGPNEIGAEDSFLDVSYKISALLGLDISQEILEDFNIRDFHELEGFSSKITKFPPRLSKLYNEFIKEGTDFKLPFDNYYYCSAPVLNKISYLAGSHLLFHFSKKSSFFNDRVLLKRNKENIYIYFFFYSFFSYITAKIINPYRKCNLYTDFEKGINQKKVSKKRKSYLLLTIDVLNTPKSNPNYLKEILKEHKLSIIFQSAKSSGHFLADVFFDESLKIDLKEFQKVKDFIFSENISTKSFISFIRTIVPKKNLKKYKKRMF